MGKFKNIAKFEKEHMPSYQYHFLYKRLLPGMIYVIGGALVVAVLAIILALTTESELVPFIPVILWGISVIPLLVLFVIHSKKNSNRLLFDKSKEFEQKYKVIEYRIAEEKLASESVIKENSLYFEDKEIRLEDCFIYFFAKTMSGAYAFSFVFFKKDTPEDDAFLVLDLESNLMTYFLENIELIYNQSAFLLFARDKKEFLKLLFKYNDPKKIDQFLERNPI